MRNKIPDTIRLYNEFKESKGYIINQKLNQFYLTNYIFSRNYEDLKNIIKEQTIPEKAEKLLSEERSKSQDLQMETLRALHNYLASAISLIDHTRNFVNDVNSQNKTFLEEYKLKIDSHFVKNELAQFIVSFRQLLQHYKTPLIAMINDLTDDPRKLNTRIVISKVSLKEFSGWRSLAKKYIEKIEDELNLLEVSKQYFDLVNEFYIWFYNKQKDNFKSEFDEMLQLRRLAILARIKKLIKDLIRYDTPISDFENQLYDCITDLEVKVYQNLDNEQKFKYIMSVCRTNNITLTVQEVKKIRKKYCS